MNKYIRSFPHTNDWKTRTYKPEFQKVNTVLLVGLAVALFLSLNAVI